MGKTDASQIIALSIFVISYILMFSGKLDRTVSVLLGLFMMVLAGYLLDFMNFEDALSYVDWEVIILLFGMMTYVGLMGKTGFFKYLAIEAIKFSKGKPWLIFVYLSLITTFVSMFIDNVTTILLVIPITVEVAEMLEINPIPIILGETVLSNIGGVGTMIGDPPNIMIGLASGYTFNDFIIHLFPPVLFSLIISIILAFVVYGKWRKSKAKNVNELMKLDASKYIRNKKKMRYMLYLLFAIILSFSTATYTGVSLSFIALAGGIVALIISMEEPKEAFKAVEWPTLVFFIALFAMVGGLNETGILSGVAKGITSLSPNVLIVSILILWVTGISSSFVDHIPVTAAFIPVVSSMAISYNSGMVWWALAMGVGIGGNLTPIGSSAGVITLSLSKRYGHEITNREWVKFGTAAGMAGMAVCTVFLLLMA